MNLDEFQKLINECDNQKSMLEIGKSYLYGYVIKDKFAAETWLYKAMEYRENELSVEAMKLLCEIDGKMIQLINKQDKNEIVEDLKKADGERKLYLEALLELCK